MGVGKGPIKVRKTNYYEVGAGKTYAHPQLALDAVMLASGGTTFAEPHIIDMYDGTYGDNGLGLGVIMALAGVTGTDVIPTAQNPLIIRNHPGQTSVVFNMAGLNGGIVGMQDATADKIGHVNIRGITFSGAAATGPAIYPNYLGGGPATAEYVKGWKIENCKFGEGIVHAFIDGCQDMFWQNIQTLGYTSTLVSPVFCGVDTMFFKGTFRAENCLWYSEAGPELRPAVGGNIDIVYDRCTLWALNTGVKMNNNDTELDYTVSLILRDSIVRVKNNAGNLMSCAPRHSTPAGFTLLTPTCSNNCYRYGGTSYISFGASNADNCASLAAWRTATGQDADSISADPLFTNVTGEGMPAPDFTLQAGSPCITPGIGWRP